MASCVGSGNIESIIAVQRFNRLHFVFERSVTEHKIMFLVFVLLVILWLLIFFYFYRHFKKCYRLWPSQNVPNIPPTFPMGNLSVKIAYTNFSFIVKDFYKKFKGSSSGDYAGVYFLNKPVLLVLTPEFAKTILAKDFQYFVNRGVYFNKEDDPLSANLFFIENSDWRTLRYKMTPTFTSGKIKTMFYTINDVADELIKHVKPIAQQHCDVEITELLARYNTDVIVSCAFGIDCNSIVDPDSEFRAVGKKMLTFTRAKLYKLYAAMLFRRQARALGFRILHNDVSTFILNMCRKTIHERKAKGIQRKDFMQLMIDLYRKDNEMNEEGLSLAEIAAQVFVFFFAGFETSSTAMTYALYELALHQGIQDRVRQEINDVCEKHDNRMTYDGVAEMTYLDQVVHGNLNEIRWKSSS